MKFFKSLGILPLALAMTACTQDAVQEQTQGKTGTEELETISFVGNVENSASTKTELNEKNKVLWSKGTEKISVFINGTAYEFATEEELTEPTSRAVFYGGVQKSDVADDAAVYALYPYDAEATISDNVITTSIPEEQVANPGNLPVNANLAVTKAKGNELYFRNVCSVLKFQIKESDVQDVSKISSIVIQSRNGEKIAGKVNITVDAGNNAPSFEIPEEQGKESIKLVKPSDGTFATGVTYYVLVAPQTLENGFNIFFQAEEDGNEVTMAYIKSADKEFALTRSKIHNFGTLELANPCKMWQLVDGTNLTVTADGTYALAYPDKEYDNIYDLFSFSAYMENVQESDGLTDLKTATSNTSDNATIIKNALFKMFRTDGVDGDYLHNYVPDSNATGATYIGISDDIAKQVSFTTGTASGKVADPSETFANTIDPTSTLSATFTSDSYNLNIYALTATTDTETHKTILGGMPDPENVLAIYKGLKGSYAGITWQQYVTSQNFTTSGLSGIKWSLLISGIGNNTLHSFYNNTSKGTGYFTEDAGNFSYYGSEALLVSNFIFDIADNKGFIPVLSFDIQALGVYAKAANMSTWGSGQMRTTNNAYNAVTHTTTDNGVSQAEVDNGPWIKINSSTTPTGVTYKGASNTGTTPCRYPTYTYTSDCQVYVYKQLDTYVGAK